MIETEIPGSALEMGAKTTESDSAEFYAMSIPDIPSSEDGLEAALKKLKLLHSFMLGFPAIVCASQEGLDDRQYRLAEILEAYT